ncbi:MAG: hypothetical protein KF866_00810 [Phycisphaeraceae bacterium]|nr:hypothetical protein [Phycisphaeraceae bacterium]MCW5755116.1 hypothetical protein [Phycisphaeraceae bacterium]
MPRPLPHRLGISAAAFLSGCLLASGHVASAQVGASPSAQQAAQHPQRVTAARLLRPMSVTFTNQRLEDAINYIAEVTRADIEPAWADERNVDGLEKDFRFSLEIKNQTALTAIELILEKAQPEFSSSGNSWQFNPRTGALEIGPKERLNRRKRVEVYPIQDLLVELPNYINAPEFDLNSVLQSGQGGGGQSPFQQREQEVPRIPLDERVRELMDLIQDLVEPEQWVDNGGTGGSIRYWQGNLIVNAPDYMHREIIGYPWWPARSTRVAVSPSGRRWVTLSQDSQIAKLVGVENEPVSAVVGGRIIRSDDPTGGG